MATSKLLPEGVVASESWNLWLVILLLVGGAAATWSIVRTFLGATQRAMAATPEETRQLFQNSEARDRENWERMWKEAGRTPPRVVDAPAPESPDSAP